MIVDVYDNAKEFLIKYESVLLERESVSQQILYGAYQNLSASIGKKVMCGAIDDGEKTLMVFYHEELCNIIICTTGQDKAIEASIILADYFGNRHILINGINARFDICQSFMEQYSKHIDASFSQKLAMDIMEIRKLNNIKPTEGSQRLVLPEEARQIADWMIQFQMETSTSELDYEAALNKAIVLIKEGKVYLYENSEHIVVSMAIAAKKLVYGIVIDNVFTPDEYRGKGYAAANLYYLSKSLLEQGYEFCALFVDKNNPLSNRAYEKVGYKNLEDNYEYKVIPKEQ